nr:P27 family phage terminase small subunit [Holdemania sp. 1001302B_160321_E10]
MTIKKQKGDDKVKKAGYKKKIIAACEQAGTYRPFFDEPINQLAEIMELRETAMKQFKKSGSKSVIVKATPSGPVPIKNPELSLIDNLTRTALSYWRDLGLTPSGLKKIDEKSMKQKKKSVLAEALNGF